VANPIHPTPFSRRRFGQHFLERAWVDKVVAAIRPESTDIILEIGPGAGALTRPLTAAAAHVLAFEIDRSLASALRSGAPTNLTVIEGDFLHLSTENLRAALAGAGEAGRLRAAGNLPYNVASPILFKLLSFVEDGLPLTDATVMLQREVADRLVAGPGTKEYGVLSVLVGHRAQVHRLLDLPPGAFRPMPRVRSAVIRLDFHAPDPPASRPDVFAALTKALFSRRRKTLANALLAYGAVTSRQSQVAGRESRVVSRKPRAREEPAGGRAIALREAAARAGLDGKRRPETLTIAELVRLSDAIVSVERGPS
jgi:16S rRNA (adenine1518-N6/adenine1519-N6)-dimethyltransferase